MGTPGTPNYHGRQLLRELKRLREDAGLTQEEAGAKLHLTVQKLSRIENGQIPGYHETFAMLKLYRVEPEHRDTYLTLWERAKERGWWHSFHLPDTSYVSMEYEASTVTEFQLGLLPELLQTESYARACLAGRDKPDAHLSVRMRRQQRLLSTNNPLTLHTLIHEPMLHQGADHEQLLQLIERAQLPNVTLQVVPQSTGMHPGLSSPLILLSFDDPQEPDIVFTESLLGLTHSQNEHHTTATRTVLHDIAALALRPDESLDLLKSLHS